LSAVVGGLSIGDLKGIGIGWEGSRNVPGEGSARKTAANGWTESLKVERWAVLEVDSNGSFGTTPGNGEWFASSDVVNNCVGDVKGAGASECRSGEKNRFELHLE
jgi:hypothetical protein